jgi:hypothetical protein
MEEFFNSGKQMIIRLVTPRRISQEDSRKKLFNLTKRPAKTDLSHFPRIPLQKFLPPSFKTSWKETGEKVKFFSTFCQPVGSKLF